MTLPPKNIAMPFLPHRCVDQMASNSSASVLRLIEPQGLEGDSGVVRRLAELGFLPGETVTVLRRGPGGREPIAVQIGETIFALRSLEAACIEIDDSALVEPA
jgi:ferrous iron transport protein A